MVTITDDPPTMTNQVCICNVSVSCECVLFRSLSVTVLSLLPVLLLVIPVMVLVRIIVRLVDDIGCNLVS